MLYYNILYYLIYGTIINTIYHTITERAQSNDTLPQGKVNLYSTVKHLHLYKRGFSRALSEI